MEMDNIYYKKSNILSRFLNCNSNPYCENKFVRDSEDHKLKKVAFYLPSTSSLTNENIVMSESSLVDNLNLFDLIKYKISRKKEKKFIHPGINQYYKNQGFEISSISNSINELEKDLEKIDSEILVLPSETIKNDYKAIKRIKQQKGIKIIGIKNESYDQLELSLKEENLIDSKMKGSLGHANEVSEAFFDGYQNIKTHSSKKESLRDKLKENFSEIEDAHLDYILVNDALNEMKGGFSSGIVVSSDKNVIKQDKKSSAEYIAKNYYGINLGDFETFRPQLKELIELENSSLLVMENTFAKTPAYILSKPIIDPENKLDLNSQDYFIKHNLFLMGLFHKEATKKVKEEGIIVKPHIYQTLDGIPHYKAIEMPLDSVENKTFREFKQDTPKNLIQNIEPIIENAVAYLNSGEQTIIDGDWKGNGMNLPNGYKVDPLFCYGKEVVDIANFLSEPNLNLSNSQIKSYLNEYISLRSKHDEKFSLSFQKHNEMYTMFDAVRLKELSVYASCMRKRPLKQASYRTRRQEFLQNTQELLEIGEFS